MVLSVAEKSYIYDSLASSPSIRPDGRKQHQFRPIEISTDFLPNSNGSSRVVSSDGSECIVSVKAKVIEHTLGFDDLIKIDLDIAGQRDDSAIVETSSSILNKVFSSKINGFELSKLQLTKKYSFRLFIDVLVLSSSSNPLSLISFAIYSALNSTLLPKLVSTSDDLEVEELPIFHDYDMVDLNLSPPLIFLLAIVGNNLMLDPSADEFEVANNGLVITWANGKVIAPIRSVSLNDTNSKSFNPNFLAEGINIVQENAGEVLKALNSA